jgi:hypothetical protein
MGRYVASCARVSVFVPDIGLEDGTDMIVLSCRAHHAPPTPLFFSYITSSQLRSRSGILIPR